MCGGVEQGLMFVLAVQFDERSDERAQRRRVHELTVDEGA